MSSSDVKEKNVSIRLSLRELDKPCNFQKKKDFLKAWKLIQELPPTNPNSFWSIASYHGMPFKRRPVLSPLYEDESEKDSSGTGKDETKTWGGYCQHGNVLFPFWHRLYCLRLEQALQSVLERGKDRVALHYWDESSEETKSEGLPHIVTAEYVDIDGKCVPNPLFKFKLPLGIKDDVGTTDPNSQYYEKHEGYETCRYPYSGIRSPDAAKKIASDHNKEIDGRRAISHLQNNITYWLKKGDPDPHDKDKHPVGVIKRFEQCLETQEYNPFSNTETVGCDKFAALASVEQPHNDLHLAIGGFTQPVTNEDGSVKRDAQGKLMLGGYIQGANGDMGANEVASYDPVFFLHHSNIDRMLWVWQKKYKKTKPGSLTIDNSDEEDKGISNSYQGATPYQTWGQKLNENTILYPFQDEYGVPRTSSDCIDIEGQLGYKYSIGSLDREEWPEPKKVKSVSLVKEPSRLWQDVFRELEKEKEKEKETQRLRLVFDRTKLSTKIDPKTEAPFLRCEIPMFLTGPVNVGMKGTQYKLKDYIQVKNINKDKISGSFLVQVFCNAAGKLYYLGWHGVLSRWNRSNCANCQGRTMADVCIPINPIKGNDSAPYYPKNLEVHLVSKDVLTGKYKRDKHAGEYLARASGEQKPSLRILGVLTDEN